MITSCPLQSLLEYDIENKNHKVPLRAQLFFFINICMFTLCESPECQDKSPIFRYVVLIMQLTIMGKELKFCIGVLLRDDPTGHGHPNRLGRKGLDGRVLFGQSSEGHLCRILIIFP